MEGEKKRKRTENGVVVDLEVEKSIVLPAPPQPPPSEAEVEEFFAILRRMHVAAKYLEKSAQIIDVDRHGSSRLTSSAGVERMDGIVGNCVLDLNTVPEGV